MANIKMVFYLNKYNKNMLKTYWKSFTCYKWIKASQHYNVQYDK